MERMADCPTKISDAYGEEGRRRRGRPRSGWEEWVKRDVREARVEGSQEKRKTAIGMGGVREERRQGGTSRRKAGGEEADRGRDGRSA